MIKRLLGNSNLNISELCLGTMYFGTNVSKSKSVELLDYYLEKGGNFIDTANNYAWWVGGTGDESESVIGDWQKDKKIRDDIVLASKIGSRPTCLGTGNNQREGLAKQTIVNAVEDSLRRLKTDYLDLCYIHADLEEYPLEERLEALEILKNQGKILNKGCSNIKAQRVKDSEELNRALGFECFQSVQQKYSVLLPQEIDKEDVLKFLDKEMMAYAEENQVSLLTYSILLSGGYEKGIESFPSDYRSSENIEKYHSLKRIAKGLGCSISQLVLQLVKNESPQIIPIISASRIQQLDENIKALDFKLPVEITAQT